MKRGSRSSPLAGAAPGRLLTQATHPDAGDEVGGQ